VLIEQNGNRIALAFQQLGRRVVLLEIDNHSTLSSRTVSADAPADARHGGCSRAAISASHK
jgi:hypothetical protein